MEQAAQSLLLDVERGPDWLLVKLGASTELAGEKAGAGEKAVAGTGEKSVLADTLWCLLGQHFTYRLVLDCEQLQLLDSTLIGQLLLLERRIRKQGGLLRLCGLSEPSQQALHRCRLDGRLPHFSSRNQAVLGHRPAWPR